MIRLAQSADKDAILAVYRTARQYMAAQGNAAQWGDTYPPQELLEEDIRQKQLYVVTQNGVVHGVFAFIIGDDPTYAHIEEGGWQDDRPYGAIHRVASDGVVRGVLTECLDFCKSQISHLRIDTHENNRTMRYLLDKHGFGPRGIIYTEDGSPRMAYEYSA